MTTFDKKPLDQPVSFQLKRLELKLLVPRYKFPVCSDGEMPRFDAHQVIESEFKDQTSFGADLAYRQHAN